LQKAFIFNCAPSGKHSFICGIQRLCAVPFGLGLRKTKAVFQKAFVFALSPSAKRALPGLSAKTKDPRYAWVFFVLVGSPYGTALPALRRNLKSSESLANTEIQAY